MKILLMTTHLNSGGIASYLLNLSRGLVRRGHEVHIIFSGGNQDYRFIKAGAQLKHLPIRTKSELSWRIYAALPYVMRYVQDNKIDILHAQTRITQVMSWWIKRIENVPYVATCHGFFKRRVSRVIFPCWGDHAIAISDPVRRHLMKDFHVPEKKVTLIESGISLDDFPMVTDDLRRQNRQQLGFDDEPLVGIVARLSDVKGQDVLIKAFLKVIKKIPDAKLLIVGRGREEPAFKRLVEECKLQKQVFFYPEVDRTYFYLSAFDVFVNPSRQEGLGLSVIEAQASGIPTVASRVGGVTSLIEHGKTGYLVASENVNGLAEMLIYVLENPAEARGVARVARQSVQRYSSADIMVDRTLEVYAKLLESHGR
jgi:glycosyltransferase involved in cell wall biosynthesis